MFICIHVDASVLQILLCVFKIPLYVFQSMLSLDPAYCDITQTHIYFVHLATCIWDMVQIYL